MPDPAAPVQPRPAASLILLRQADGLEVLMGRRGLHIRAFPGATVFPGGKLEPQDAQWPHAADPLQVAGHAALRETFEETGLLVTADGVGPPAGADIAAEREAVEAGRRRFADLQALWGCRLDLSRLTPFARWVTPEWAPYRFDTLFFVTQASSYEASASLIGAEFERLDWVSPQAVLNQGAARLISPTRHCLEVLRESQAPGETIRAARARGLIDGAAVRARRA